MSKFSHRHVVVAALTWVFLGPALSDDVPHPFGDSHEYVLTHYSFYNHGSPDVTPEDLADATAALRNTVFPHWPKGIERLRGYFETDDGRRYGYHFPLYAAVTVPAHWLVEQLGGNPLRGFTITNVLFFAAALWTLASLRLTELRWYLLLCLTVVSPVTWYLRVAHPEAMTYSLGLMAGVAHLRGKSRLALVLSGLAAMQFTPYALFSLAVLLDALRRRLLPWRPGVLAREAKWIGSCALCASLSLGSPAWYLLKYGVPTLIDARASYITVSKVASVFAGVNQGMLGYAPGLLVALLLAIGFACRRAWRDRTWDHALAWPLVIVAAATVCATQRNWNGGTIGPTRYAVYLMPMCLTFIAQVAPRLEERQVRSVASAVALQLIVTTFTGWLDYRGTPMTRHNVAARLLLRHIPWAFDPEPTVFCVRTRGRWCPFNDDGAPADRVLPVVYRDQAGRPRKIYASGLQRDQVARALRELPPEVAAEADRRLASAGSRRIYLSF